MIESFAAEHSVPVARRRLPPKPAHNAFQWRMQVREAVAKRIIPSMMARQPTADPSYSSPAAVAAFVSLLLASPFVVARAAVQDLLGAGAGFDDLMLLMLAPAARHLGDLWLADRLTFLEVTRGSAVLQALVRYFGPDFEGLGPDRPHGRAILLAPVPGEQHVLGLCMLATVFRRAGWHVVVEPQGSEADILAHVEAAPFDIVGLSASGTRFVDRMPKLAAQVRTASRRAGLRIMAGGTLLFERHAAGAALGVDGVARDARDAVAMADRLAPRLTHPI